MTNGEILADCVNRQFDIVRRTDPEADVLVWDDMFCPHRSAKEEEFHVWVPGGFPNRDALVASQPDYLAESLQDAVTYVLGSDRASGTRAR